MKNPVSRHHGFWLVLTVVVLIFGQTAAAYNEAPSLAERVAEGTLPPLEERLPHPDHIYVVDPVEEIGTYGGTWRMADTGPGLGQYQIMAAVEPLIRWQPDLTGYQPGLARDWEYSEDGTVFTIYLREGVKWSDGHPFTADDIMFWWEDLVLNREHGEGTPRWAWSDEQLMEVEKIDDYTVQFSFAASYFTFHTALAQGFWENVFYYAPKHYLSQYHPDYSEDGDYSELMDLRTDQHHNPEYPVLYAWKPQEWDASEGVYRAVRNPYYWKTDTEGNQLPYIDEIQVSLVQDTAMVPFQAAAGELDAQFRLLEFRDISLLIENEERGGYRVILWEFGEGGAPMVFINWDVTDEVLRPVFRDQNFRKALSYAIDRNRINQTLFGGLGRVQNATMSQYLVHYEHPDGEETHERWANAYADFDPEKAEQLLDEAGIVDANNDGWRQTPDGEPINLLIDAGATDIQSIDALEFFVEDWAAIGINASVNSISGDLISARSESGELHFQTFGYGSEVDLLPFPDNVFPVGATRFHPLTGRWQMTGGEEGEEPTGVMRDLLDLYYKALRTGDVTERHGVVLEAINIHIEEGPFIYAPVAELPAPILVADNFRNVPEMGLNPNGITYNAILAPWAPGFPGTAEPSQFFFKE